MRGSRLSPEVRQLGFTKSPVSLEDFLRLRQVILSSQETEGMSKRVFYPEVIFSCEQCGKSYQRKAYDVLKWIKAGGKKHFCSSTCFRKCKSSQKITQKACADCGEMFNRRGAGYGIYCPECLARRRTVPTVPSAHPPLEAICPVCRRTFVSKHRGHGQYAIFCSKRCAERGHSRSMSGKGNPMWKHGATPLREQPHSAKAFRKAKKEVLARDGYRCARCSALEKLHVHHIDGWPMNNYSSNLVTLCPKCHVYAHKMMTSRSTMSKMLLKQLKEAAKVPLLTT